ncbi:hypothetical protein BG006_001324, partial [Podila minutissima]
LNMTSLKACILLLVAVATANADGRVLFRNTIGDEYHVNAGIHCANFPGWINDQSVTYRVDEPYHCVVFEHHGCSGRAATIVPTNGWVNVPFIGISGIQCWKE